MRRRLLLTLPVLLGPLLFGLTACQTTEMPQGAAAGAPRDFTIFFEADSAALGEAAEKVAAAAVAAAKANATAKVAVRGFAAPDSGTAAFNRALSEARARSVSDALVQGGIPASRISIESRGAVAFELMPTESRRVEIRVGG